MLIRPYTTLSLSLSLTLPTGEAKMSWVRKFVFSIAKSVASEKAQTASNKLHQTNSIQRTFIQCSLGIDCSHLCNWMRHVRPNRFPFLQHRRWISRCVSKFEIQNGNSKAVCIAARATKGILFQENWWKTDGKAEHELDFSTASYSPSYSWWCSPAPLRRVLI